MNTTPGGLSVIVDAVEQARKIFERMNSYAIYRVSETIRADRRRLAGSHAARTRR